MDLHYELPGAQIIFFFAHLPDHASLSAMRRFLTLSSSYRTNQILSAIQMFLLHFMCAKKTVSVCEMMVGTRYQCPGQHIMTTPVWLTQMASTCPRKWIGNSSSRLWQLPYDTYFRAVTHPTGPTRGRRTKSKVTRQTADDTACCVGSVLCSNILCND